MFPNQNKEWNLKELQKEILQKISRNSVPHINGFQLVLKYLMKSKVWLEIFFKEMTIRLQEVVRSETEGGLTGPANPIPSQSIDCGCGQLPCPKLARFATRRLFVALLSWIGLVQTAAYVYFYVAGPMIARKFQFDPYVMGMSLNYFNNSLYRNYIRHEFINIFPILLFLT